MNIAVGRRALILIACAMLVINATVISLAPVLMGSGTGEGEGGDTLSTSGEGRARIAKVPGDPNDGLGPPDEVYEDVEGPPAPDEKY